MPATARVARVRRFELPMPRRSSYSIHVYGAPRRSRDADGDEGWPCTTSDVILAVGIPCPECGCWLRVEAPTECEGDAVCEHCGDRVGRVVRLSPSPKPKPALPEVKPSGLRWSTHGEPLERVAPGSSWWLHRGGQLRGVVTRSLAGWSWVAYSVAAGHEDTLANAARALVAAEGSL